MTPPREHSFAESLALSEGYSDAPWWEDVYRAAFPAFGGMVRVKDDGWGQRGGVDRAITLTSGKTLYVDEKVRTKEYDDILLEVWSDRDAKTLGWVRKDLACDFIAYAFVQSCRCYLLPFQTLRKCWENDGAIWWRMAKERIPGHQIVEANNRSAGRRPYTTVSITVPTNELMDAMKDAMLVTWGDGVRVRLGQNVLPGVLL